MNQRIQICFCLLPSSFCLQNYAASRVVAVTGPSTMLTSPPLPKFTVNCAGAPVEVERTAVIW